MTFRDLWPNRLSIGWSYLACGTVLSPLAVYLEAKGLGASWIVLLFLVLILPSHVCLYLIRRRFSRGRTDKPTAPHEEPPQAMVAGA